MDRLGSNIGNKGGKLAGCLLNFYKRGEGSIPWYSDEIRAHGSPKCVATLSLGGPRPFQLRRSSPTLVAGCDPGRKDGAESDEIISLSLQPGSLLIMAGDTQARFEHLLPLIQQDWGEPPPPRISLTFRSIVPGFEKNTGK